MTRIVLLLTAVPLAAVLALILNTLLDRRLAAIATPRDRAAEPGGQRFRAVWLALALLAASAGAPALAHATSDARHCASIDCSLLVEAALVDRIWKPAPDVRVAIVAQSRIPVWFDAATGSERKRDEAQPSDPAEGRSPGPAATPGTPATVKAPGL